MSGKYKQQNYLYNLLNDILQWKLTSICQYFLHAEICDHWGFIKLYKKFKILSLNKVHHADILVRRILFLGGLPNLNRFAQIHTGETVLEQFQLNLALESESIKNINEAIQISRSKCDNGSKRLLELILKNEEYTFRWIEQQIILIDQLGEQNYLIQYL